MKSWVDSSESSSYSMLMMRLANTVDSDRYGEWDACWLSSARCWKNIRPRRHGWGQDNCFHKIQFIPKSLVRLAWEAMVNGFHWLGRRCPIFHPLLLTRARRSAWQWRLQWIYQQISTVASQGSQKLCFFFPMWGSEGWAPGTTVQGSNPPGACLNDNLMIVIVLIVHRRGSRIRTARENKKPEEQKQQQKRSAATTPAEASRLSLCLSVASDFNHDFVWYWSRSCRGNRFRAVSVWRRRQLPTTLSLEDTPSLSLERFSCKVFQNGICARRGEISDSKPGGQSQTGQTG